MNSCVSCDEREHDTCLNLLRPGTCECSCPLDGDFGPPVQLVSSLVLTLGRNAFPGHQQPGQQPVAPWPPGFYCGQHHLIEGDNAYYDRQGRSWQCRTCRRATWRNSKRRNRNGAP